METKLIDKNIQLQFYVTEILSCSTCQRNQMELFRYFH